MRQTQGLPLASAQWPRFAGRCRLLPTPAASGSFPTLSLRIFPKMPGSVPRWPAPCICPILPTQLRPSPHYPVGRRPQYSRQRLQSGSKFRGRHHSSRLQASWFARHPGRSHHTAQQPHSSGGFSIRAEHTSLPPCASDMLAVRSGQLTAKDSHLFRFAALSAAPIVFSIAHRSRRPGRCEPFAHPGRVGGGADRPEWADWADGRKAVRQRPGLGRLEAGAQRRAFRPRRSPAVGRQTTWAPGRARRAAARWASRATAECVGLRPAP